MRKISMLLLALLLVSLLAVPVAAETDYMVDDASLLTLSEENTLQEKLSAISQDRGMDVVIVTVDSLDGYTATQYADDFFDYNGYGENGVLLLLSMEDRDWAISTTGTGISTFTDAGQEYIMDCIQPELGEDAFYDAFVEFAELCDDFIRQAQTGEPYDSHNLPKEAFAFGKNLLICLVIGIVVAFIATSIMKGKLKTVRFQQGASNYCKPGSLQVTEARDFFLYRHVDRHAKPKASSGSGTHISSSGRSHGGSSGKF